MKRRALITFAILSTMLTGCSTIDWVGTGETWHENLCRDQNQGHCPEEDHINGITLR